MQKKNIVSGAIWVIPFLFLFDDVLGTNGYQLTVCGISIRILLFCLSFASLCCYCLYTMLTQRIVLLPRKEGDRSLWRLFTGLDIFVAVFILGNLLWATVIPVLIRGERQFALKDFSTIATLALYYPLAFLIRTEKLRLQLLERILYVLCLLLALWHSVMYLGDVRSPGFYAGYYEFIEKISFGTAVMSPVVYGFGIVRVIQVTSLFLLPGVFLCLRYITQGKYWHIVPLFVFTLGICTTFTKSIWFGYVFGAAAFLLLGAVFAKSWKFRLRSAIAAVLAVLLVVFLNYAVFDGLVFSRVFNTTRSAGSVQQLQAEVNQAIIMGVRDPDAEATAQTTEPATTTQPTASTDPAQTTGPTEPAETTEPTEPYVQMTREEFEKKQNELRDALGTREANNMRAQQNSALLKKLKESPVWGFGYGAYTQECIRNYEAPYMYESTLLALAMKLGVVGCLLWVVFILAVTVFAWLRFWKTAPELFLWWIGLALSYALSVQTNPFLFTIPGFSILLYLLVAIQTKKEPRS